MVNMRLLGCAFGLSVLGLGALGCGSVQAMPISCQVDLDKMGKERQVYLTKINNYNKKRPSATSACTTFNQLNAVDTRMLKYLTDNKDWCQITDQFLEEFTAGKAQASGVRDQACTMAKKEQAMIAKMRAQQGAAGAPPPGSGVQLPKGAL
jgi:hypothetical protein